MVPLPIIFLAFLLLYAVVRPVATLFHELGHGVSALWLTSSDVKVYIGSYGDADGSWRMKLGRLELYLKYNLSIWTTGVCHFSLPPASLNHNIVITLAGPVAALLLCVAISLAGLLSSLPGGYKGSVWFFLVTSVFEFLYNLYPRSRPVRLHDGTLTYNDGWQIITLLDYKRMPPAARDALPFFATGEYEAAGEQLRGVIDAGAGSSTVYRLAISAFLSAEKFGNAEPLSDAFMAACRANADDHSRAGLIKARLDKNEEALSHFDASLQLDSDNGYSLVNRGYVLLLLQRYEEAIRDFDRAIAVGHETAYAQSHRGLAKIKSGNVGDGLGDIRTSLEMDGNKAYAHKNLGIYYFDCREYALALAHFEEAHALDPKTHQLQTYLASTRQMVEEAA